eukprot:8679783-Alexandrium_andersonii.AAC.1
MPLPRKAVFSRSVNQRPASSAMELACEWNTSTHEVLCFRTMARGVRRQRRPGTRARPSYWLRH